MPITFTCGGCQKTLRVPDTARGKTGQCPSCGTKQKVPLQGAFFDAVPVAELEPEYEVVDDGAEYAVTGAPPPVPGAAAEISGNRKPCPMCGEMILASAVKCRFCGEVFDATLREATTVDPELVKSFRKQVHALGGIWIFFGSLCMIFAFVFPSIRPGNAPMQQEEALGLAVIFGVLAAFWLTAGICACLKHLWAIYFGLVITYLSALGNVLNMVQGQPPNLCGIGISVAIIIQAHRTITWARKMKRAGIPLDTHPDTL